VLDPIGRTTPLEPLPGGVAAVPSLTILPSPEFTEDNMNRIVTHAGMARAPQRW